MTFKIKVFHSVHEVGWGHIETERPLSDLLYGPCSAMIADVSMLLMAQVEGEGLFCHQATKDILYKCLLSIIGAKYTTLSGANNIIP